MTDISRIDLEVKIQNLHADIKLKENQINSLKNLMDDKINDKQREDDNKKFLSELKNFRNHQDFSKFLKEINLKIEKYISDYQALQGLYKIQKNEIKELQLKNSGNEHIMQCLRDNQIFVEIEEYVKEVQNLQREKDILQEKYDQQAQKVYQLETDINNVKSISNQQMNELKETIFNFNIEKEQYQNDKKQIFKKLLEIQLSQQEDVFEKVQDLLKSDTALLQKVIQEKEDEDREKEEQRQLEIRRQKEEEEKAKQREEQLRLQEEKNKGKKSRYAINKKQQVQQQPNHNRSNTTHTKPQSADINKQKAKLQIKKETPVVFSSFIDMASNNLQIKPKLNGVSSFNKLQTTKTSTATKSQIFKKQL